MATQTETGTDKRFVALNDKIDIVEERLLGAIGRLDKRVEGIESDVRGLKTDVRLIKDHLLGA